MDLDTYRQASRQTWDEMSAGWEERRDWLIEMTGSVNAWIVDQVDPQPRADDPRHRGRHGRPRVRGC